ncbi:unnamed protein product, partial [Trichogramma brassicae]
TLNCNTLELHTVHRMKIREAIRDDDLKTQIENCRVIYIEPGHICRAQQDESQYRTGMDNFSSQIIDLLHCRNFQLGLKACLIHIENFCFRAVLHNMCIDGFSFVRQRDNLESCSQKAPIVHHHRLYRKVTFDNETADDAPQKPTDPLLSSLDIITKKVQMIKARLDKTLNETKSSGLLEKGRHDTLIETGYRLTPGAGYHKLYLNEMSWHDALNFCRRKNAHLAVVNSTAELDVQVSSLALPLSHRRCSTPDRAKLHLCTCNRLIPKDETHFNVAKTGLKPSQWYSECMVKISKRSDGSLLPSPSPSREILFVRYNSSWPAATMSRLSCEYWIGSRALLRPDEHCSGTGQPVARSMLRVYMQLALDTSWLRA